jgi:hypothetical protein
MVRCVKCKYYPWVVKSDPGMLPPYKCHPELPYRSWTDDSKITERDCDYYEPSEVVRKKRRKKRE